MKEIGYLIPWDKDCVEVNETEILILGSGIAGLFTALNLNGKYEVSILTKKKIRESNTELAQGGIAVALNREDSPEFHYGDTINAGAGLCNLEAVKIMAEKGPDCVRKLIEWGTQFDTHEDRLDFTREGAHTRRRVLRAKGDATGYEIERALVEKAKESSIQVKEDYFVIDLLKNKNNEVAGVLAFNNKKSKLEIWLARAVVIATGGLGQLYKHTTNPGITTGDGIAAAYRAGAEVMDMEFIQFHPTALLIPGVPSFLISEAARGEGALLVNSQGKRFMEDVPGKELAPRDIVARAIWAQMRSGTVYLDFSFVHSQGVQERFPKIYKTCLEYGIDISATPVPVGPAAHYLMGGIKVNILGQTNLSNLYACGECACNGVHGANRLASNSLLDGLVFSKIISDKLKNKIGDRPRFKDVKPFEDVIERKKRYKPDIERIRAELREIMWDRVGIIRDAEGLADAYARIERLKEVFTPRVHVSELELGNMLSLGSIIVKSATERLESRGGHYRSDYPVTYEEWRKHSVYKRGDQHVSFVSI